ncbi:MAG: Gfo/Idh/MocA family oxidoreductase [Opitutaceae bacterium]|nr:Gfo/Idh/MocA family oxidoreductase [Opitutaceae bacterium]
MVNLAFISAAHVHTGAFIEAIQRHPDGRRVQAVWDDLPDRGKRFARLADAPYVETLEALLNDTTIDGFIIAAENSRHADLLESVLPVGKPVFCEKPLVVTTGQVLRVRRLVRTQPALLICGYFHPYTTELRSVAALIDGGTLGKITRARFRNAHHGALARWFDDPHVAWIRRPETAAGGGFLDLGTHAIHQLQTLFGPVAAVWADIGNESGVYPEIDDYGVAHLRFASGLRASVEAGWTQSGGTTGLELQGSQKSVWRTASGYVVGAANESPQPLLLTEPAAPACIDRLVAAIRGEVDPHVLRADVETALHTVEVMAACYRSSQAGTWTPVAPFPTP